MRGNTFIPRLVMCLCAAFLAIGAGTVAADGFRVVAVEVRGAKRVAPDAVRKAMKTQVGQELDLSMVRQDVKAIYRMGYFRDVTFDTEEVPDGYRLTVIVAEKPIVGGVQVEGNKMWIPPTFAPSSPSRSAPFSRRKM